MLDVERTLVIRPVRLDDGDGIAARVKTGGTVEMARRQVEWTSATRAPRVLEHLVAELDGVIVGNVMLMLKGAHASANSDGSISLCAVRAEPEVGRLDDWVVAGELHRQGIGSALARGVIDEARAWGLKRLESSSENHAAIAAFLKLGFTEYGRLPLLPGHPPQWHGGTDEVMVYLDLV